MSDLPDTAAKSFHLWITTADTSLEAPVVNKLIERGYSITFADGKNITLKNNNGVSQVIALRVERFSEEKFTAVRLHADTMDIIKSVQGKHYSVIVSEFSYESGWCASHVEYGLLLGSESTVVSQKPN
jgi:hypothetical protein